MSKSRNTIPVSQKPGALSPSSANILVTGGAGFIGSNFIRYLFEKTDFQGTLVNYDKLTYAGNLLNLSDIDEKFGGKSYFFVRGDIRDYEKLKDVFARYHISAVVHFAAESHVDRSIFGPKDFIETNVNGTFTLLEASRQFWGNRRDVRFHHISTDEVYGSLGDTGYFYETTPYDPRSPYSASKAASDHIVRAYFHTYGLPVTISNCSNNYGPYHFPEKLIPLIILNAIEGKPLPVYGDGKNVRDWLYVEDHCEAVWFILNKARTGETFNVGGECEKQNIEVVREICDILEELHPLKDNPAARKQAPHITRYSDLITFVTDRPGHDRRYAINCDKIKKELGWKQKYDFENGLRNTVSWYLHNKKWVEGVRSGEYIKWIETNYHIREK
ncbi:MAG: dTDP-glucose 4,6-dehydratase [Nitrospiraceae bacterium]|nr:MAG: dTDP-glucose 4,6-dehydratase [Nitrospiraceae bacterium]